MAHWAMPLDASFPGDRGAKRAANLGRLWFLIAALTAFGFGNLALSDAYAGFDQKGARVSPSAMGAMGYRPYDMWGKGRGPREVRERAWLLRDPLPKLDAWLVRRGFWQGFEQNFDENEVAIHYREYLNEETGETAAVLEGPTVPKGTSCVLLIREPTGASAAWRGFVRRLKAGL